MKPVLAPLFCVLSLALFGQSADTSKYQLPEIVLSASKAELNEKEVARHLIRVTGDELRSNSASLNESLEHLGSIDIQQRSPFDVQADLSIRGGTFDQSLVLIDGIPMLDPQTGHHSLNLPLTFDQVDRVEILTGGSRFFGPQAFSWAVNIITNEHKGNYTKLHVAGGQKALFAGGFTQGVVVGEDQMILSYSGSRSDGYMRNTDFTNQQINGKYIHPTDNGEWVVQGGWNGKAFGANSFYSVNFPDQFEQTQTLFGGVRHRAQHGNWKFKSYLMARRHYDRFELFRESYEELDVPSWYTKHNYHRTDVIGAEWTGTYDYQNGHATNLALTGRTENIVSNNLGDSLAGPIEVPEGDEFYYLGRRRQNYSLNLEHYYNWRRFYFSGGVLLNLHSDFGFDVLPGLDVSYEMGPRSNLFASVNRSFRTPTYTDLYYNVGGALGSPLLKPEYAWNYELGYKAYFLKDSRLTLQAVGFYRQGKDLIDWIEIISQSDTISQASNITEIDFIGFELEGVLRGKPDAFVRQLRFSYTYMQSDKAGDFNSLYVLNYLRHKIGLGIEHKLFGSLSARWDCSLQDRASDQPIDGTGIQNPVTLVNLRINADLNALNLYISANNLLDQQFQDRSGVRQPGIWVYGGASWSIINCPPSSGA